MYFVSLHDWNKDDLTSLILNISRDFSAQDACYSCSFNCTIESDMRNMSLAI